MGGRSASLTAGGGGGRGGGGGGSERQLAPAVQQLFDMSVSPLIHTGGGAVPSRGKTEPGTQMRHLQQSSGSSKKGGEVSFGHSSPSQSLLHLLRQGSSQTQHRTPRAPKPSAVDGVVVLATPAYQAPATSTSQDSSAQGIQMPLCSPPLRSPLVTQYLLDLISPHFPSDFRSEGEIGPVTLGVEIVFFCYVTICVTLTMEVSLS